MSNDLKRTPNSETVPYHLNARHKTKSYQEKLSTVLAADKRLDSRKCDESRKICKL